MEDYQNMDASKMEYMVWLVEIVAANFFAGNKAIAYQELNKNGIWNLYLSNYDVTHTLSADYVLSEIKEILTKKEVL